MIPEKELPDVLNGRKASEVFLDYTMPIIDSAAGGNSLDLDELDHALRVPWMIWNACIYDRAGGKKGAGAIAEMKKQMPGDRNLRDMFLFFEQRKKNDFSQYNYLMGEYELVPKGKGEFNLRMESRLV